MKQEVQVTVVLTLWADVHVGPKALRRHAIEIVTSGEDLVKDPKIQFTKAEATTVREEAEIYGNR